MVRCVSHQKAHHSAVDHVNHDVAVIDRALDVLACTLPAAICRIAGIVRLRDIDPRLKVLERQQRQHDLVSSHWGGETCSARKQLIPGWSRGPIGVYSTGRYIGLILAKPRCLQQGQLQIYGPYRSFPLDVVHLLGCVSICLQACKEMKIMLAPDREACSRIGMMISMLWSSLVHVLLWNRWGLRTPPPPTSFFAEKAADLRGGYVELQLALAKPVLPGPSLPKSIGDRIRNDRKPGGPYEC